MSPFLLIVIGLLASSCMGIRHITIDTREPGKIPWASHISSVVVVNNVVQQPDDIGHSRREFGQTEWERATASSEYIATYYMAVLAELLADEGHFGQVLLYPNSLRTDTNFFAEQPIPIEVVLDIMRRSGTSAVISLDRLLMQTELTEHVRVGRDRKVPVGEMIARIQSIIRIYLPVLVGEIPVIHYSDSLRWEGFYFVDDDMDIFFQTLPTREAAMMDLAFRAAERMTRTISPHWVSQERWFYTSLNARMREGANLARGNHWDRALDRWKAAYNSFSRNADRARAANNIALAYEMLDDIETALDWAIAANGYFVQSTSPNSLERRRSALYKAELQRRWNVIVRLFGEDEE